MEINVTKLFAHPQYNPRLISASIAELGPDAGQTTYDNSLSLANEVILVQSEDEIEEAIECLDEYGAWELEDMKEWSLQELNALIIQFVTADAREALPKGWESMSLDELHASWPSDEEIEEVVRTRSFPFFICRGMDGIEIYYDGL
jgi:hypothetical protein